MANHDERILLVHLEEEEKFVEKFKDVFEKKGFSVLSTLEIEDAIDKVSSEKIDLLVCDLDGQFQTGLKLFYKIKRTPELSKTKIIALTGAYRNHGINLIAKTKYEKDWLNVDMLIQKPIGAKNLYLLIKKELAIMEGIDTFELDSAN